MALPRRIVITGSTGNLGRKAVAALAACEDLEIVRIDRNAGGEPGVISADLTVYDPEWTHTLQNAGAILHLAADPRPTATWDSILRLNIDLTMNVLRAAEEGRAGRFVFASSNWVLGGHRFTRAPLSSATPPRPINPYGASKLLIERVGLATAARAGISFISLRIGYCQPGDNRPGPHMAFGRWGQEMWLSNEDWAQAVRKACTSPFRGSAVLNIMSSNSGMRWDLEEARAVIEYEPVSRHTPRLTLAQRLKQETARLRDRLLPGMAPEPLFGSRW